MLEATEPPCRDDLVGLCIKPAFDLDSIDGVKSIHEFDI